MTLYEALNMGLNIPELTSFVGVEGKTSTMFRLAQELSAFRKKVLVTATTKGWARRLEGQKKAVEEDRLFFATIRLEGVRQSCPDRPRVLG
jgi:hypothetical protein